MVDRHARDGRLRGVGYRDDSTSGVATGSEPQGAYMIWLPAGGAKSRDVLVPTDYFEEIDKNRRS